MCHPFTASREQCLLVAISSRPTEVNDSVSAMHAAVLPSGFLPAAACVLAITVFIAPLRVQGQCQAIAVSVESQPPSAQDSSPAKTVGSAPEFFDEPQFIVAGVTDASTPGGHGADVAVRNMEELARDTVSLSVESENHSHPTPASPAAASENSLREALDRQPDNFGANRQLGRLLVDEGNAHAAIPFLERAFQRNSTDYDNAYELALGYADDRDYKRARATARTLMTTLGKAPSNKAELHHLLGDVEEKLGNPLNAVREYQRAAELDPGEPNFFDWGAELLMHRAFEPAGEVFTQGNYRFPRSVRMLVGLGVVFYDRGAYGPAAQCLCEASDLNPADPAPYQFMGKIQDIESTQPGGMGERLERFARLQPENALANYYYAVSLWKQRTDPHDETSTKVESLLEKAVHLDPKLAPAYLQLGILYAERNDWPRAIRAHQDATKTNPQLEEAHYRLAQAYRRTGENLKAQEEFQLHAQLKKQAAEKAELERRQIQEFVYALRDRATTAPPAAERDGDQRPKQ